jgi:hypothetical protein
MAERKTQQQRIVEVLQSLRGDHDIPGEDSNNIISLRDAGLSRPVRSPHSDLHLPRCIIQETVGPTGPVQRRQHLSLLSIHAENYMGSRSPHRRMFRLRVSVFLARVRHPGLHCARWHIPL